MDRRKEPRFLAKQPVTLTLLNIDPKEEKVFDAALLNISGRGMSLETSLSFEINSAIRVDIAQQVFLGEVCHCQPAENGTYLLGLYCKETMKDKDLYQMYRALMDEEENLTSKPERIPIP